MILKVLEKRLESSKVFSLIFKKPRNFTFYPGQYLDLELPVKDRNGNTRTFTISSSPNEPFLMITSKVGVTPFKKAMERLKKGDIIKTSHPIGTFTLDESSPAVFIAGGIGITPFRSMIKSVVDYKLDLAITLLYSNPDQNFLFEKELVIWSWKISNLKVIYHSSSQNGHISRTQLEQIVQMYGNTIFYLAGAPKMVDDFETMLLALGVDKANIRYDRFDGY